MNHFLLLAIATALAMDAFLSAHAVTPTRPYSRTAVPPR